MWENDWESKKVGSNNTLQPCKQEDGYGNVRHKWIHILEILQVL